MTGNGISLKAEAALPSRSRITRSWQAASWNGWVSLNREMVRGSLFIDEARCDALCAALKNRVAMLADVVNDRRTLFPADNRSEDVAEDIAYSGKQNVDEYF